MAPRVGRNPRRRRPATDANVMVLSSFIGFAVLIGSATAIINISVHDVQMAASDANAEDHSAYAALLMDRILQAGHGWYTEGACVLNGGSGGPAEEDPENPVSVSSSIGGQGAGQGYAGSGYGLDETKFQPEAVEIFGLGVEPCGMHATRAGLNALSYAKFATLFATGPNGAYTPSDFTYDEARRALGVDFTGLDFRLTVEPVLHAGGIRAAYIGDFEFSYECVNLLPIICDQIVQCIQDNGPDAWDTTCAGLGNLGPPAPPPSYPAYGGPALIQRPGAQRTPGQSSYATMGDCAIGCVHFWYSPQQAARREAAYLANIVPAFTAKVGDVAYASPSMGYVAGGDVYPDQAALLTYSFESTITDLSVYNVIIVGSRADNTALMAQASGLQDWVEQGGVLVVLGSNGRLTWMLPFGYQQQALPTAAVSVVDESDPLLSAAAGFPWAQQANPKRPFEAFTGFSSLDDLRFPLQDTTGNPVLAVSDRNVFGEGYLVLTGYQPWNLQDVGNPSGDACEGGSATRDTCAGFLFMENMVLAYYERARLSMGPSASPGAAVDTATSVATLDIPQLDSYVDVKLRVEVFGALERAGGIDAPRRCENVDGLVGTLTASATVDVGSLTSNTCGGASYVFTLRNVATGIYDIEFRLRALDGSGTVSGSQTSDYMIGLGPGAGAQTLTAPAANVNAVEIVMKNKFGVVTGDFTVDVTRQ